jgi:hypothetical protein
MRDSLSNIPTSTQALNWLVVPLLWCLPLRLLRDCSARLAVALHHASEWVRLRMLPLAALMRLYVAATPFLVRLAAV